MRKIVRKNEENIDRDKVEKIEKSWLKEEMNWTGREGQRSVCCLLNPTPDLRTLG